MKLKIISKTKNEYHLIETWIKYHAKLVGYENIVIFDNILRNKYIFIFYNDEFLNKLLINYIKIVD